jgi:uncharacterized protein (UPF0212 family)
MASSECSHCKRTFQQNGSGTLCSICATQEELVFKEIKEYLEKNPGASMSGIVYALNVTVSQIKKFLREDRLYIIDEKTSFLKCEKCGRTIRSGVYCDECERENNFRTRAEINTAVRNFHQHEKLSKEEQDQKTREVRLSTYKKKNK